ncbi:hypothetical protein JR316_0010848 [Psilocybe cubensis]|uniref:Uncharacterized protein n=1 Tax=Psilocybe cubensis TaxID=181762 RepID=A0ACB8GNE8_PSICU|nr:hypothetical protein JR316_0010848 [Psilocybe cubensis]KAH9476932.1 hypothetical protein JR316_0010848 [Psilocybe cubensis]
MSFRIDDRDSIVSYSKPAVGGHWSSQGSSTSYQSTLSLTRTRNAHASVSFTGTSISVYGLVSPSGTGNIQSSSYSVDGSKTEVYMARPIERTQSQVLFYDSGPLVDGQHTLLVTNLVELDFLWIDYFLITSTSGLNGSVPATTPAAFSSSTLGTSTTSTSFSSTASIELASSVLPTQSTVGQDDGASVLAVFSEKRCASSNSNLSDVAAIVGGIVGGISLIILMVIVVAVARRTRQRERSQYHRDGLSKVAFESESKRASEPSRGLSDFDDTTVSTYTASTSYSFDQRRMVRATVMDRPRREVERLP